MLGWYLLAPPIVAVDYRTTTWDLNAPMSRWTVIKTFDSAMECEEWTASAEEQASESHPIFDVDRCVVSDDPRLQHGS